LSLAVTVEFYNCRDPNNYPGYPRDRLSVVKYRQLARQVGAFSGFASKSSMDLNNMIFLTGLTFIFRSWICEADGKGKLQGCLHEDPENQKDFALSAKSSEELTGELSVLAIAESTQVSPTIEFWVIFVANRVLFRWDSGIRLQSIKRLTQAYFRILP
jgi:hypothetical protein